MKKFITLVALLACAVIGSRADVVFSGDAHNVAGWNAKQMPVAEFPVLANASAGDVIVITVTAVVDDARICLQNTSWAGLGYDEYNVETGVYPFVLTEAAATEVKNNGLIVTGQNYSFNKVELLYQKTLWEGNVDATTSWEQSDALSNALFADLQEGDILGVTVTEIHEGDWHLYALRANYATNIIEHSMSEAATGVDVLSEAVVTSLKSDPIILVGSYLHATAIHTYVAQKGITSLWSGSQAIGEWSNELDDIPASKLTDLQVGNILCVRVSAIGTEAAPRVALAYGNSWENFSPVVEYYFQGSDEAPMVVEFPVTYKMEQQLRGNKLVVRGVNYTVTEVFYKEGTPATNVAAYLDVTSAGMATYVLPFNVPTLPDGVKAYRLTNDGSNEIVATEVSELTEDKPVLIVADEGEYEFLSQNGASDDVSEKTGTYQEGALVGTYVGINPVPASSGSTYNYVLQNGGDGVAFYQVTGTSNSIAPYHAYLSCSYNSLAAEGAPVRIRFVENTATGNEEIVNCQSFSRKLIKDGQLLIIHDGKTYNAVGQLVK